MKYRFLIATAVLFLAASLASAQTAQQESSEAFENGIGTNAIVDASCYLYGELCADNYTIVVAVNTPPSGLLENSPDSISLSGDNAGIRHVGGGSIGGYVWKDFNLNGVQDENEIGVSNATVNLYDEAGNLTATTLTNKTGYYLFSGLFAGNYLVGINETELSPHWNPTIPNQGSNDSIDSDDPLDGSLVFVNLSDDDANNLTIDFGFIGNGSIGDYVWDDTKWIDIDGRTVRVNNNIQDENDTGIPNVTLILYDSYGNHRTNTTTNSTGYYLFKGLFAGNYTVKVDHSTVQRGLCCWVSSEIGKGAPEIDSNDPSGTLVILPDDTTINMTIDFGYYYLC